jgi:hypothetical protein
MDVSWNLENHLETAFAIMRYLCQYCVGVLLISTIYVIGLPFFGTVQLF